MTSKHKIASASAMLRNHIAALETYAIEDAQAAYMLEASNSLLNPVYFTTRWLEDAQAQIAANSAYLRQRIEARAIIDIIDTPHRTRADYCNLIQAHIEYMKRLYFEYSLPVDLQGAIINYCDNTEIAIGIDGIDHEALTLLNEMAMDIIDRVRAHLIASV